MLSNPRLPLTNASRLILLVPTLTVPADHWRTNESVVDVEKNINSPGFELPTAS